MAGDVRPPQFPLLSPPPPNPGVARKATLSVAPCDGHAQAIAAYEAVTVRKAMSRSNPDLTPRELDVLAFLPLGKTNREIAAELHLSEGTVKQHLRSTYKKLGVSNRTEAAMVGLGIFSLVAGLGELGRLEPAPRRRA